MQQATPVEPFFRKFAWIIFGFVVFSFGGKALFDTADLPPITPLHHFHAVSMLLWFALFAVQPTLIQSGHTQMHRLLGRCSILIVIAFFCFAAPISLLNWNRVGEPMIITANGTNLLLFACLYIAAIANRRNTPAHSRLMTYATILLIGPAAGRIPEIFDEPNLWAAPIVFGFQLVPLLHDIVKRRVQWATIVGFTVCLLTIPVILGLSGNPAWKAQLEAWLGPAGAG